MIVGLTGGIGSGKSTVALIFKQLGVPVYDADSEAKKLLDTDVDLQQALVTLLGDAVLQDGKIDRPKMAAIIFNNKDLLEEVNKLIHPAVGRHFKQWHASQKAPYVLREAAILFESGSYKDCAFVVTVYAPEALRIARVMQRNGIEESEVRARMQNQWPEEEKLKRADFVVYNDGEQSLIKQVLRLHEDLISKANTST
jgi:dephospho-CoA kinase